MEVKNFTSSEEEPMGCEPLVSIVIPTFNRADLLKETLGTVLLQTYTNWECIIVDDGSTDATEELLEKEFLHDKRFRFFKRPHDIPKGANACRNYGFKLSKGEYIKWLDSDDLLHSDYLQMKTRQIGEKSEKKNDLVVCNASYFSHSPAKPDRIFRNVSTQENLLLDYLSSKVFLNTPVTLWKRKSLIKYQFDESLARAQELDFHFRILKNENLNIRFVDEVLVFIRNHNNSITGDYQKGGAKHLSSELKVRRNVLQYLYKENVPIEKLKQSFRFYILGLIKFSKFRPIQEALEEVKNLENAIATKAGLMWKFNLIKYLLVYKLTGRDYRLEKHINNLPNLLIPESQK